MSVETIGSGKAILPWQQMIASCSGAFLTALLMTPLDVVKTRLQVWNRRMQLYPCRCVAQSASSSVGEVGNVPPIRSVESSLLIPRVSTLSGTGETCRPLRRLLQWPYGPFVCLFGA